MSHKQKMVSVNKTLRESEMHLSDPRDNCIKCAQRIIKHPLYSKKKQPCNDFY